MYSQGSQIRQPNRVIKTLILLTSAITLITSAALHAAPANQPNVELYPRAEQPITIQRGLDTISVRPLKTVNTMSNREALADRLLVVFRQNVTDLDQNASHLRAKYRGAGLANPLHQIGRKSVLVDVTGATSLEAAALAYKGDPNVVAASPDWVMHAAETPNDTLVGSQWSLNTIQAPAAWNRTHGSTTTVIAILDTGINEAHSDLMGKVIARRDFTGSPSGTNDVKGHGTHVAGTAAASTNNSNGVAGVGYNSRLLNVKVLDDTGSGTISMLYDGIYWATDNGAHIINMSLGSNEEDCSTSWWEDFLDVGRNELRDSIDYAWTRNVVLVAAAGNDGSSAQKWPGACPNVVSVANTNSSDIKASSSNFGTWVDVAAPGSGILSTAIFGASSCGASVTGGYGNCSGTSMASPHVAGLAALIRSSCGFSSSSDIVSRLTSTADAISGTGTQWQFGRVNALRAVCFPVPASHIGSVSATSLQVVWTDPTPGETRFEISKQLVGSAVVSIITVAANTTSYLDSGLATGISVDYRVRACDSAGCSAWSNTTRGTTGAKLSVSVTGSGKVTSSPAGISCGMGLTACNAVYTPGTSVKLTATPYINLIKNIEWEFDHWEGACTGSNYTCTVSMTAARTVKAVFVRIDTAL